MEYSTEYSMEYENTTNGIFEKKMAKKKWIWSIPGIFQKNKATSQLGIFVEYGILRNIRKHLTQPKTADFRVYKKAQQSEIINFFGIQNITK